MKVLYITLLFVIIDQVTKFLIKGLKIESLGLNIEGMPYGSSKPLIGDIVRLTFIENPGMAFGIDIGPKMFLTLFTILASIFIFIYIYRHRKDTLLLRVPLALILAGAIGNLIDRSFYGVIYGYAPLFHGKVVDFIQVEFWDFTFLGKTYTTWPIFNIADLAVSVGFITIMVFHNRIFKDKAEDKSPTSDLGVNGSPDPDAEKEHAANYEIPGFSEPTTNSIRSENSEKNADDSPSGTV
ncbi:MAG: signal peptidase II [Ignavibacteria bacterium]|nr:signal peptidase II [Ignavibacteria bacterium]